MTKLPTIDELTNTLNNIASNAALLFQAHPNVPGWEVTRPGAFDAEVFALKNAAVYPAFTRLSLRVYYAGEVDDNEIVYGTDTYIVETLDGGEYPWEERAHDTPGEALRDMATIMLDVTDCREETEGGELAA